MAKTLSALKAILRREEALLEKLKDTAVAMVHGESKAGLKEMIKDKKAHIKSYAKMIKRGEKCEATKKKTKASKGKAKVAPKKKKKAKGRTKKSSSR